MPIVHMYGTIVFKMEKGNKVYQINECVHSTLIGDKCKQSE